MHGASTIWKLILGKNFCIREKKIKKTSWILWILMIVIKNA